MLSEKSGRIQINWEYEKQNIPIVANADLPYSTKGLLPLVQNYSLISNFLFPDCDVVYLVDQTLSPEEQILINLWEDAEPMPSDLWGNSFGFESVHGWIVKCTLGEIEFGNYEFLFPDTTVTLKEDCYFFIANDQTTELNTITNANRVTKFYNPSSTEIAHYTFAMIGKKA
jgi:hypothetical protein